MRGYRVPPDSRAVEGRGSGAPMRGGLGYPAGFPRFRRQGSGAQPMRGYRDLAGFPRIRRQG